MEGRSKDWEERETGEEGDVGCSVGGLLGEVGTREGETGREGGVGGTVMASGGGGVPADRKGSVPYGTSM